MGDLGEQAHTVFIPSRGTGAGRTHTSFFQCHGAQLLLCPLEVTLAATLALCQACPALGWG
jgi:hypothetical protein